VQGLIKRLAVCCLLACVLAACTSTSQLYGAQVIAEPTGASLKAGDLASFGIAFITPSTVTGQEEDKPALALAFSQALEQQRPNIHVVPLIETLSSVNREGLFEKYTRMIIDYRESGLLDPNTLARVKATGARYICAPQILEAQRPRPRKTACGMMVS